MDSGKGIKGWELNHKHSTLEDDITHCFSSKIDCLIEVGKFAGAERGPACHDGGQALGREGEGRQEVGRDREGPVHQPACCALVSRQIITHN